jgi:GT2 family glycosyltransferase
VNLDLDLPDYRPQPAASPKTATATNLQYTQRYRFVRPLVRGRRVLEWSAGEGSADYLAQEAAEVVAPRCEPTRPNIRPEAAEGERFDVVLDLHDREAPALDLEAHRAPDGLLVTSVKGAVTPEMRTSLESRYPFVRYFHQTVFAPWDLVPGPNARALATIAVAGPESASGLLEDWFRPTGIVIPVFNNLKYSDLCLRAVSQFTGEPSEIVIVDNGSTDRTREWTAALQRAFRNVRVITNAENRGFAPAVNQGIAALPGHDIVLLNNDVIVTPGWLGRLRMVLREDALAGIVGPISNYAAAPQRIHAEHYGENLDQMLEYALQRCAQYYGAGFEARRLSGFCFLIRREVVEKIGGLDERFLPGFFEDDDYGVRARLAGFRLRVAGDVFVHHYGSRTFRETHADANAPLQQNWLRFKQKWGVPLDLQMGESFPGDRIAPTSFDPKRDFIPLPCLRSA